MRPSRRRSSRAWRAGIADGQRATDAPPASGLDCDVRPFLDRYRQPPAVRRDLSLFQALLSHDGARAVMAGTGAEYAWTGSSPLRESDETAPHTLYDCQGRDPAHGLRCGRDSRRPGCFGGVFRLYGPAASPPPGRLLSDVARALVCSEVVESTEGRLAATFCTSTMAPGLSCARSRQTGTARSIPALVEQSRCGSSSRHWPQRPAVPNNSCASEYVLRDILKFRPKTTREEGLAKTYA